MSPKLPLAKTYDDARWHLAGVVPAGTTERHAFAHIGVYIAWLIARGLHEPRFFREIPGGETSLDSILRTRRTPAAFRKLIDGTLPSELMNPTGRAFTDWYYGDDHALYLDDWVELFGDVAERYRVPDGRATFAKMATRLDQRFAEWSSLRRAGGPRASQPPPGDDFRDIAGRAVESVGGEVVPNEVVAQAASYRGHGDSTADDVRREWIAQLAMKPVSEEAALMLRSSLSAADPVVLAIAADALSRSGHDEALPDLLQAVRRGPISNDLDGWRALAEATVAMAARVGASALTEARSVIEAIHAPGER